MAYQIFLVEDEKNLNKVLKTYLENEGWQVVPFFTGEAAKKAIGARPHLWILDIMLPGIDGYQLLREIKADYPFMPVIFISARDEDIDRIVGLEMGGDDYLAKPFIPKELVIRSRRLLERTYRESYVPQGNEILSFPPYLIDQDKRQVKKGGMPLELTSKEFDLLFFLARNPGKPLSREQVLASVWGSDYFGSDRVVDDLIRRLRKKLPELSLETIYGYGYRLVGI
jgi:two-component system response regulator CssR